MKTSTQRQLKKVTAQARNLAADMRATLDRSGRSDERSNVSAVIYTIEQLARAVHDSDFVCQVTEAQIANVLEIALKTRIGLCALGDTEVCIDLGNGHLIACSVRKLERKH